ncbi:DHA1 family bicyclomycin/chloramphenicol resistance-like MFS transporter [Sphingopyxis panaciterrae]|uniref:multidrug effflux MFS transporter n=1 Tax=Sphingopyxis panaciterrae TaxID=363841 RepID=UPI001422703C|nr:multidrug effflux MFS transporter [Sphingopyxis panaciterrae]NIJ37427.1 DHA1 family bicyclomycin/chloramphenicol resistance-like MFS transporter [Sphingopyxis panaciterrae]
MRSNQPHDLEDGEGSEAERPRHAPLSFIEFVILIAIAMALITLSIDLMLPALPAIAESLRVESANQRQWVLSTFLLGMGLGSLVLGPLSDRYGRKPTLTIAIALYLAASIACAVAANLVQLLLARFVAGLFAASCRIVTVSIIRDCFKGDNMARVLSLCFIILMTVPMIAPAIGQALLSVMPWRWIFGVLALLGGAVLIWIVARLPETLPPADRISISPAGMRSALKDIVSHRAAMGYIAAATIVTGAQFGFLLSIQQIVFDVFHAPSKLAIVFLSITSCMVLGSLLNSALVRRFGARRLGQGALIVLAIISLIHVLFVLNGRETLGSFSAFQGLLLLCAAFSNGNFNSIAMERFSRGAGLAASIQGSITVVGSAGISGLIGYAFDGTTLPLALAYFVAAVLAFGVVTWAERGQLFTQPDRILLSR